jgi:membrane-bound lytic murein transglycosylase D
MGKKSASTHVYHVVQKGETFYSISRKYNITVDMLHKLNHFSKQPTIYPGDKLIVK